MSPEFELNQIVDVSEINRRYPDRIHVNNSPFAENKMIVGETVPIIAKRLPRPFALEDWLYSVER